VPFTTPVRIARVGGILRRAAKKLIAHRFLENNMRDRKARALWQKLRRAVRGWIDGDHDAGDPAFMFHLLITAPLLVGLLATLTRL
jgi:hypothetical protein